MDFKKLYSILKKTYNNLEINDFKESESLFSKKIYNLYVSINKNETIENLINIVKFSKYYPDLKNVSNDKIISSQKFFQHYATSLLIKKILNKNYNPFEMISVVKYDALVCHVKNCRFFAIKNNDVLIYIEEIQVDEVNNEKWLLFKEVLFKDEKIFFKELKKEKFKKDEILFIIGKNV